MIMSPAQQWVSLNEAAKIVKVSPSKLSQMAKKGEISSKRDPKDKRKVLLNIQELQRLFYPPES
jgi:DNA-binding MarR family transcriptional regulator